MNKDLSIIIPIYNAERHLKKCLQSVFNQNILQERYEIIVINDGSVDNSKETVEHFAKKYSNIVFIDQVNQGVSAARNAGLRIAKGEIITFIDSDDEIYPNSLSTILKKIDYEQLDIFYPKIEMFDERGLQIGEVPFLDEQDEVKQGLFHGRRTFPATFYRRELLNNIQFNEEIGLGEDTVFNMKAQAFATRVSYAEIPYYKYTVRKNSLSKQGRSDKAFNGFIKAVEEIRRFQNEYFDGRKDAAPYFNNVYGIFVQRMIELNVLPTMDKERYYVMVEFLNKENLSEVLRSFSEKYPYIDISFQIFSKYQKYLNFKSKISKLIYRA